MYDIIVVDPTGLIPKKKKKTLFDRVQFFNRRRK